MKILFISSSMGFGGAERVISVISSQLARMGHEVGIYLTKATTECVYPLHESVKLYAEDKLGSMKDVIKSIRSFVKNYDPDVVVPFMTYQCIYTSFALAFTKYPVVVCERNDPNSIDGKNAGKIWFYIRDLAFSMARGAVFQTDGAKACFPKSVQKKSTVILNPINESALLDVYEGEREDRIVHVGRLNVQKNQSMLLRAFAKIKDEFPNINLEIYGDGEMADTLKQLCTRLSLDGRVLFMGNVKGVGECIRKAKLFAFSSDCEGMPNALAEAMALGLPCVSTDCSPGGARMLIHDGVNGIITPCKDADRFAEALRRVLSDEELARSLGRNAVGIRERMNIDTVAKAWEDYLGLVAFKKNK